MTTPTIEEVLMALNKQRSKERMSLEELFAAQYYRRHHMEETFMSKLKEAKAVMAARQSSTPFQPLMPITPSNLNKSRSDSKRHDSDRQRDTVSTSMLNELRSRWTKRHGTGRHQPYDVSQHHRSRSPNSLSDGNHSSSDIRNTSYDRWFPSTNRFDREQYQTAKGVSNYSTMSSTPIMEKFRFYYGRQRPPTPINDDHIVDQDECDWNSNSHATGNNNATPSVSVSNSQSEPQIDEPAPFRMGTLKNIDNSCYMNSLLYILRMTPTFVHSIHHLVENMRYLAREYDENIEDTVSPHTECPQSGATSVMVSNKDKWPNDANIKEPQMEVVKQLHRIFSKLTAREKLQDAEPLEKKAFQAAIREIAPNLTEGVQQDTHEFLLILLNCIRECSASLMQLTKTHGSMFENIFDPASRLSFDLIEKNFIGKELTTRSCVCCETTSDRTDDVMYFYIPLTDKKEFGKHFIQESCLTKEYLQKIKCERCLHSQESIQLKSYPQLPRVLIFQLGRFDNQLNKKHTITPTPMQLDCFCTPCTNNRNSDECIDHKYHLYGVIIHLGTSLRSGHYTAYARTFNDDKQQQQPVKLQCESDDCCQLKFPEVDIEDNPDMENGFWYNCNDETIDVISGIDFQLKINRKSSIYTPYILFYVRNDHLANY